MLASAKISIMEVTLATSRARMAGTARGGAKVWSAHSHDRQSRSRRDASCGYPDVKSDDKVCAAEALGLFTGDTVACLDTTGDSATQRRFRRLLRCHSGVSARCCGVTGVREVVQHRLRLRRLRPQMREHPAPVLDLDLQLVAFEEDPVLIPAA
jgi:hypothetical protein